MNNNKNNFQIHHYISFLDDSSDCCALSLLLKRQLKSFCRVTIVRFLRNLCALNSILHNFLEIIRQGSIRHFFMNVASPLCAFLLMNGFLLGQYNVPFLFAMENSTNLKEDFMGSFNTKPLSRLDPSNAAHVTILELLIGDLLASEADLPVHENFLLSDNAPSLEACPENEKKIKTFLTDRFYTYKTATETREALAKELTADDLCVIIKNFQH